MLNLFISKRSKKLLAIALVPSALAITTYSVHAAYPVFDAENIAKTVEVIKNTTEQINKLNEQVNLAKEHLAIVTQSMKDVTDGAKSVLSSLDGTRKAVDDVISNTSNSFNGFLAPIKDVQNVAKETQKKWDNTFHSLSSLSIKNITYSALQGSNSYLNSKITENNKESMLETQAIINGLDQAEKELQQLRQLARTTTGQRDLAKINAEINAVTARIQGFNSRLMAIQTTNQNMESQATQQKDANRAEYNFAAAKKFSHTVVTAKGEMNDLPNGYGSRMAQMKKAWGEK